MLHAPLPEDPLPRFPASQFLRRDLAFPRAAYQRAEGVAVRVPRRENRIGPARSHGQSWANQLWTGRGHAVPTWQLLAKEWWAWEWG